jgi:hypothetical protein
MSWGPQEPRNPSSDVSRLMSRGAGGAAASLVACALGMQPGEGGFPVALGVYVCFDTRLPARLLDAVERSCGRLLSMVRGAGHGLNGQSGLNWVRRVRVA